jgi:DNA helicase IV
VPPHTGAIKDESNQSKVVFVGSEFTAIRLHTAYRSRTEIEQHASPLIKKKAPVEPSLPEQVSVQPA